MDNTAWHNQPVSANAYPIGVFSRPYQQNMVPAPYSNIREGKGLVRLPSFNELYSSIQPLYAKYNPATNISQGQSQLLQRLQYQSPPMPQFNHQMYPQSQPQPQPRIHPQNYSKPHSPSESSFREQTQSHFQQQSSYFQPKTTQPQLPTVQSYQPRIYHTQIYPQGFPPTSYSNQIISPSNYQVQNYTVHGPSPSVSSLNSSPDNSIAQLSGKLISRKPLETKSDSAIKVPKKRGRKKKANTVCTQCKLENTPEWRKGPEGPRTLCNACGLFFKKLCNKFGVYEAGKVMVYKKDKNEIFERLIPSEEQRNLINSWWDSQAPSKES